MPSTTLQNLLISSFKISVVHILRGLSQCVGFYCEMFNFLSSYIILPLSKQDLNVESSWKIIISGVETICLIPMIGDI